MRVLVVDDDPSIRLAVTFALRDEGYEVDEAASGLAALELVGRTQVDLILLDMKMPGMDGWEFVRIFRERFGRQTPIVVVTAAQDAGTRAAEVDADGYLAKPFDLDVLVAKVATFARGPGVERRSA